MTNVIMSKKSLLCCFFIIFASSLLHSYTYLGVHSPGVNFPDYRVYRSVNNMDVYKLIFDEIEAGLRHGFLLVEITPRQEVPNLHENMRNLFRRTGGDLAVGAAPRGNGFEVVVYFFHNGRYYGYLLRFLPPRS